MNAPQCPTCRTTMQEGFMIDRGHHGALGIPHWVEGQPVRSVWTGLKLKGRAVLPTQTYRCERCGLLQSFAPTP